MIRNGLCWSVRSCALLVLFPVLMLVSRSFGANEQVISTMPPGIQALHPGERLVYDVSWSNIITAGISTMEVKDATMPDGSVNIRFVVTGRSVGLVDAVFPVDDTVQSVFNPKIMQSVSYSLRESFGKKKETQSRGIRPRTKNSCEQAERRPPRKPDDTG